MWIVPTRLSAKGKRQVLLVARLGRLGIKLKDVLHKLKVKMLEEK